MHTAAPSALLPPSQAEKHIQLPKPVLGKGCPVDRGAGGNAQKGQKKEQPTADPADDPLCHAPGVLQQPSMHQHT